MRKLTKQISGRKISKRKIPKKQSKRKQSKRKQSKRKQSKRKQSRRKQSKRKQSRRKISKRKQSRRKIKGGGLLDMIDNINYITLASELHDQSHDKSLVEYCKLRLLSNPNCKILLEYNPGADPTLLGSDTIRTIYNMIQDINKEDRIVPYDYRSYFITVDGQRELYNTDLSQYTIQKIRELFVDPFFIKQAKEDLFRIVGNYKAEAVEYLLNIYYPKMVDLFTEIGNSTSMDFIVHAKLKDAWMMVSDYYILTNVLRLGMGNEFIVVGGQSHIDNIDETILNTQVQTIVSPVKYR